MKPTTLVAKAVRRLRPYLNPSTLFWTAAWNFNRMFRKSVTVRTKQGLFCLPLTSDDPISQSLYIRGRFELDDIESVMPLVFQITGRAKGIGALLDIGANNGVISIGMLTRGEVASAIAIEPDPENFRRLEVNVALNGLEKRVSRLNFAASNEPGSLQFELSDSNLGDHRIRRENAIPQDQDNYGESRRKVISVPSRTLDALLADQPDSLGDDIAIAWIDVQGFEGYVFLGGEKTFSRGIPAYVEIWPYGIRRSGIDEQEFVRIVSRYWTHFWWRRAQAFERFPITELPTVFQEMGPDGKSCNVLFSKE